MYILRQINFDVDSESIQQFNRTARFPIVSTDIATEELDDYFGAPSIEGFALGIFEGDRLVANIQCSTAGFLATDGDSDMLFLSNRDIVFSIETLPEFRHRGYANRLLQSAFDLTPWSLFVGVIAYKDITNRKLKEFYSNAGFDVSQYEKGFVTHSHETRSRAY